MTGNDPFDRQLTRGLEHLAGPEPDVDVVDVARRASGRAARSRLPSLFGAFRIGIAAAVIALFAGALFLSGVLGPTNEDGSIGASPTAPATFAPPKVSYASGSMTLTEDSETIAGEPEDGFGIPGSEFGAYPLRYAVTSTDPRFDGVATVLEVYSDWEHEATTDDIDAEDPGGPWRVEYQLARIEIRNDDGAWSGTIGPRATAEGSEPLDGAEGLPGFDLIGPGVLAGSGDYVGLWALVEFTQVEDDSVPGEWVPDGAAAGTFQAVITNREIPGSPTDALWRERTGE